MHSEILQLYRLDLGPASIKVNELSYKFKLLCIGVTSSVVCSFGLDNVIYKAMRVSRGENKDGEGPSGEAL